MTAPLRCLDCSNPYAETMAMSLLLPRDQWLLVNPDDGGVLCANCIIRRASALPGAINVTGRITFAADALDTYRAISRAPPRWQSAPTPEEVRAHAVAHSANRFGGLWLRSGEGLIANVVCLQVALDTGETWISSPTVIRLSEASPSTWYRWCPCTVDGIALRMGES